MEMLLVHHPRIVVKDSAVNAICYGAKLMIPGVLRFDSNIDTGTEIVMMTTKGEAIALGIAQMPTAVIATVDHGAVAVIKRVLMERDLYDLRWGYGPRAQEKKKLILAGQLDSKGKVNENTPKSWLMGDGAYLPKLSGSEKEPIKEEEENTGNDNQVTTPEKKKKKKKREEEKEEEVGEEEEEEKEEQVVTSEKKIKKKKDRVVEEEEVGEVVGEEEEGEVSKKKKKKKREEDDDKEDISQVQTSPKKKKKI
eukprot:GHVL01024021.1.p2 GENE.GHVL01024021.1~~GHVL01024021.1.p2  ORF type:complete len:252 (+),score=85.61 GHVL01024021.1:826-1581(+)